MCAVTAASKGSDFMLALGCPQGSIEIIKGKRNPPQRTFEGPSYGVEHVLLTSEDRVVNSLERDSMLCSMRPSHLLGVVYKVENEFECIGRHVEWQDRRGNLVDRKVTQKDCKRETLWQEE